MIMLMENSYFLQQKIEFLEIQLHDMQQKDKQAKLNYETMINNLFQDTNHSLQQHNNLKIEEIRKKHSNELLLLKYFFKQKILIIQEKLSSSQSENKYTKQRFAEEKQKLEEKILNLEYNQTKIFQDKQTFEN